MNFIPKQDASTSGLMKEGITVWPDYKSKNSSICPENQLQIRYFLNSSKESPKIFVRKCLDFFYQNFNNRQIGLTGRQHLNKEACGQIWSLTYNRYFEVQVQVTLFGKIINVCVCKSRNVLKNYNSLNSVVSNTCCSRGLSVSFSMKLYGYKND